MTQRRAARETDMTLERNRCLGIKKGNQGQRQKGGLKSDLDVLHKPFSAL